MSRHGRFPIVAAHLMDMSESTLTETPADVIIAADENGVERTYVPFEVVNDETVTIPAGTYVVGDPCYTVPDACWSDWLEACDYRTAHVLAASIDGHPVVGIGTAFGDGGYEGSDGFSYSVDAGLIGLVPVALAEGFREDLCTIVEFTREVVCSWSTEEGTITLGHITIKTDPAPEPVFCFSCGRPSDYEEYCTWGCGYGEDVDEDEDLDDDIDDEDEE